MYTGSPVLFVILKCIGILFHFSCNVLHVFYYASPSPIHNLFAGNVEVSYETEMCISETGVSELCISGAVIKAFESHNQVSPTTRGLYLSRPSCRAAMDHQKRGDASLWRESALYHSGALRPLKDFVDQCLAGKVLSEVGRVWLILDSSGQPGLRHRDHNIADFSNEFVWLRDPYKAFQVFADDGSYAQSPTGIAAWFDARWQHQAGAPLLPPEMADDHVAGQSPPLSISLRVDGRFTPELRAWKHQAERWRTAD